MNIDRYRTLVIPAVIGVILIILVGLTILLLAGDAEGPALDQGVQEVGLAVKAYAAVGAREV